MRTNLLSLILLLAMNTLCTPANAVLFTGQVIDADTKEPIPSRVYIQDEKGNWYFPRSVSPQGSAVEYKKENQANKKSVEMHTTLSAHPFSIHLKAGTYRVTIERGKEYRALEETIEIKTKPVEKTFELKRWIDMAGHRWYSGDTHVHRTLGELPNVMLAEDLNVAFPLIYWVHDAGQSPAKGKPVVKPELIAIDPEHVIYPLNTEYEIMNVGGKSHSLGAFFILNHAKPFDLGVPPVTPAVQQARAQGALLELDKHNWPWSMMLVPTAQIDLYELSNNHVWRTEFAFTNFGEPEAPWMNVERTGNGFTEWGWIEYGFQNYYTLLDCGFKLQPTAGTASGVHPVPLGFGRVYVRLAEGFNYGRWLAGLKEGNSFITTGPMLTVNIYSNDEIQNNTTDKDKLNVRIAGQAIGETPLTSIEIILNGKIAKTVEPLNAKNDVDAFRCPIDESLILSRTSWVAVRCRENRPDGRVRFAHSAPVFFTLENRPLYPQKEEIDFLISRMETQIERNKNVLSPDALAEYENALKTYRAIAQNAQ